MTDTPQQFDSSELSTFLDCIQVVLVNTTLPANIGSAARALKTMGISRLTVVNPKHPVNDDALAHAAGAKDILASLHVVDSLADAIADSRLVFAASSRLRSLPWPLLTLKQSADMAITQHLARLQTTHSDRPNVSTVPPACISLVFGREDRGLTNEELALANYHLTIPTNPAYGVLNVAAAVQVVCYEFFATAQLALEQASYNTQQIESQAHKAPAADMHVTLRLDWDEAPASHDQLQQLEAHYLQLLTQLDLYDADNPRNTKKRVQRLLARTQLDEKEYNLLRATLARALRLSVQSTDTPPS